MDGSGPRVAGGVFVAGRGRVGSKEAAPNRWAGRMATGWAEQRNPAPIRCRPLVLARSPLGQWKAGREGPGREKEQKEEPSQRGGGGEGSFQYTRGSYGPRHDDKAHRQ